MRIVYRSIYNRIKLTGSLFIIMLYASCVNTRDATYFNNIVKDTTLLNTSSMPVSVINVSDILSISISSLNPQASSIFNTINTSNSGIIVDSTGFIQLPFMGNIKASGLTINQLKNQITRLLIQKELLLEPIVTLHYLNYKITVLGEVAHPLVITVPNEKISILEAIGLAGDLTIYGKRNSVLLIRENEVGQKTFRRLNLNSGEIFRSPYYYLKSNDVIYVEPNKSRIAAASRTPQLVTYVLSGLSLALIIVQLLRN